ncbi:MAG: hypothetical protein Q8L14_09375 [Myxococcales bacterium]|nr:hypothetical protein [Myxococcales bacterium]
MNTRITLLAALLLGACDWSPIEVDSRTYPCATDADCGSGWSCQASVCVSLQNGGGGGADSGAGGGASAGGSASSDSGLGDAGLDAGSDGGIDAGGVDAGGSDAGGTDAGGVDAGGTDAGGTDAGRSDAGADAGGVDAGLQLGCTNTVCWVDPLAPGPINRAAMVRPRTAVLVNDSFIVVVSDAGTVTLGHDAGDCYDLGGGPNGDVWLQCYGQILRLQLEPSPRLIPALPSSGNLSFSTDGGVWRRSNSTMSQWVGFGWVDTQPVCLAGENLESFSAITANLVLVACGGVRSNGPFTVLRVADTSQVRTLAVLDAGPAFLSASDDFLLASNVGASLEVFLDGGTRLFPVPGSNTSSVVTASDGRPQATMGQTTWRLDEMLFWQPLTNTPGFVDSWGAGGLVRGTGPVTFFGNMTRPAIPTYDPLVTGRTRGTFVDGPKPRVVMGPRLFELEPTGLRFIQANVGSPASGLRDGGFVAVSSGPGFQLSRAIGRSPSSIPVPAPYSSMRGTLLLRTGEVLAVLSGATDGGHLFQVELDGGFTRRSLPMVNPDFLARYGESVIVGRQNPPAILELGAGSLTSPPGSVLDDVCTEGNLMLASTTTGLFLSEDGGQTWRLLVLVPGFVARITCGAGLLVGQWGQSIYVSDGGSLLHTQLPTSLSFGSPYIDPETGRIWLSSMSGDIAYLR